MMENKLVKTLREAIELTGLKSGMSISFHHHLRNGDYTLNRVMDEIAALGIRDLTLNASSLFDVHAPLEAHIKSGVVRRIRTNYMSAGLGRRISAGIMAEPVEFRTHGGRPSAIASGETPIDVAFIAAPSADCAGNMTGKFGPSACGSLGYAFPDAMYAKKVVVITDNLVDYPLRGWSIPEIYVDYVVAHCQKRRLVPCQRADQAFNLHGIHGAAGSRGKARKGPDHEKILRDVIGHDAFLENLAQTQQMVVCIAAYGNIAVTAARNGLLGQMHIPDIPGQCRLCGFDAVPLEGMHQLVLGFDFFRCNNLENHCLSVVLQNTSSLHTSFSS